MSINENSVKFEINYNQSSVFWVMGKRSLLTSFWPTMSSMYVHVYIFSNACFFMDDNKSKPHSCMFFLIGGNKSVFIHQMTKRRSQVFLMQAFFSNGVCIFSTLFSFFPYKCPFKKAKGLIQRVLFHPTRPFLFVAVSKVLLTYWA